MKRVTPKLENRTIGEIQIPSLPGKFDEKWWNDVREFIERLRKQIEDLKLQVSTNTIGIKSIVGLSDADRARIDAILASNLITQDEANELLQFKTELTQITNSLEQKISVIQSLTPSEIKSLYESNEDTNAFTDQLRWKLIRLEELTAARIKELYESNTNTNAFTDILKEKLENLQSDKFLQHHQTTPAGTWEVPHTFGRRAVVNVFDDNFYEIRAAVEQTTTDMVVVRHSVNRTGYVLLT